MHEELYRMHSSIKKKIVDLEDLLRKRSIWRLKSQRVVFTNGVFDLIHPGHVDYLAKAADLGHQLIVGLNSDSSVRTLNKGADRPINPEMHRASIVAALQSVSAVTLFTDHTPIELIRQIEPDILVKGGDYDATCTDPLEQGFIVGSDIVRQSGGIVTVIPFLEGYSSTRIIEKIRGNG